jgi:hypothetical protein
MDIKKELLKAHSLSQTNKVVRYIGNDEARFAELIRIFLDGPYRLTQRAAWPLSVTVENHPELVEKHLKSLLDFLSKKDIHDAVKRNVLRLLQFIELPARSHGKLAELCFGYLADRKEPIAIRVFAMSVLTRLAKKHPALKTELTVLIEDEWPYASPAFISRGRKVLKQLNSV